MTQPDLGEAIARRLHTPQQRSAIELAHRAAGGLSDVYGVAELDKFVELARTNPDAFAHLPADTRRLVALRAANLANRETTQ